MNRHTIRSICALASVSLMLAACAPKGHEDTVASKSAAVYDDKYQCTNEPRTDENDKRPRCGGMAVATRAPRAYRFVGGSGDPIDQVVCDISQAFVLDGKMFGTQLSGGFDGTYKLVRMPNIPGLHWRTSGRYHIEFPDGPDKPGTMIAAGDGTTTAGALSRDTTGGERFVLTPVAECKQ